MFLQSCIVVRRFEHFIITLGILRIKIVGASLSTSFDHRCGVYVIRPNAVDDNLRSLCKRAQFFLIELDSNDLYKIVSRDIQLFAIHDSGRTWFCAIWIEPFQLLGNAFDLLR